MSIKNCLVKIYYIIYGINYYYLSDHSIRIDNHRHVCHTQSDWDCVTVNDSLNAIAILLFYFKLNLNFKRK